MNRWNKSSSPKFLRSTNELTEKDLVKDKIDQTKAKIILK